MVNAKKKAVKFELCNMVIFLLNFHKLAMVFNIDHYQDSYKIPQADDATLVVVRCVNN